MNAPRNLLMALSLAIFPITHHALGEEYNPLANPQAIVVAGNARLTILTPRLIRMEWAPDGKFEDHPSYAFINRRLPVPPFQKSLKNGVCLIETEAVSLRYKTNGPVDKDHLEVRLKIGPHAGHVIHPPFVDNANLLGTTRTLDGVSGPCPLEAGLISRNGWTFIDDSNRVLFDNTGWAAARENKGAIDWYLFVYGNDYKQALADFIQVAGRIPLPPRFVFGAWWSRYWAYTDAELRQLVQDFRDHDVPLDVLVVDMDWHLDGWTGYTWNPKYFPDPPGFLRWAHDQGLHVTLNLHPADGVGKHEQAFPEFCKAMGLDPKKADRIPFDCTSRRFMEAYFNLLHHPLEKMGVDFWWVDWQQGTRSRMEGLDPLPWLNHLHWSDMQKRERDTGRRPLVFSRWGSLGSHRYPIEFSGDTYSNWPSLAFQSYFTATAGNIGSAYWSHDIGGHMPGTVDPELYARWIQSGALSPVLRTHTTKNPDAERRIWSYPPDVFRAAREAFELRYQLLPYIYTQARICHDTGLPLCRPLYYEWPDIDDAYRHPGEFLFGDSLLAAPITEPADPLTGCVSTKVWIPPGEWINWFTGRKITGPVLAPVVVPLHEIPLFARAGSIIPTQQKSLRSAQHANDPVVLNFFPGDGQTRIYEDDGQSAAYRDGQFAWIPVAQETVDGNRKIAIGPVEGSYPGMPPERRYIVNLYDMPPTYIDAGLDGVTLPRDDDADNKGTPGWWYYGSIMGHRIHLPAAPGSQKRELLVSLNKEHTFDPELHDGFRGLLSLLVRTREMLGNDALGEYRNVEELLLGLGYFSQQEVSFQQGLFNHWLDVFPEIQVRTPDRNLATRAILRLIGFFQNAEFRAETPDAGQIAVRLELGTVLSVPQLRELTGELKLAPSDDWSLDGSAGAQFPGFTDSRPFLLQTRLKASAGLNPCVLSGTLRLTRGEFALEIHPEFVILPSINEWWIVGPFDCPASDAVKRKFEPESKLDLTATYSDKAGRKISWQRVARPLGPNHKLTDEFYVDLASLFPGQKPEGACFACTHLVAPSDVDVVLALGSAGGVAIWLNGVEVHRVDHGRIYQSRQDRIPVRLRKGVNTVLLKTPLGGRHSGFCVHVETKDGRPLTQVRATLKP